MQCGSKAFHTQTTKAESLPSVRAKEDVQQKHALGVLAVAKVRFGASKGIEEDAPPVFSFLPCGFAGFLRCVFCRLLVSVVDSIASALNAAAFEALLEEIWWRESTSSV